MNDQKEYLKQKLIAFQQSIVRLNHDIRVREEQFQEKEKDFWLNVMDILDACDRLHDYIEAKQASFDKPGRKLATSFGAIRNKINRFLKTNDILPLSFESNRASREFCKVVETRPDENLADETILAILKTGYIDSRRNTVLRKAEVVTVLNREDLTHSN